MLRSYCFWLKYNHTSPYKIRILFTLEMIAGRLSLVSFGTNRLLTKDNLLELELEARLFKTCPAFFVGFYIIHGL